MIRLATRADLPEIQRVMHASIAALSRGFYDEPQTASAVRYIGVPDGQLVDDGTYFVIEEEGRVVACGGWSARAKLFTGTSDQAAVSGFADVARIRAMFVDPACARRGLGRRILEASENAAQQAGFTTFELMATLPGVPLYEACGYRAVEDADVKLPDGVRLNVILMRKSIGNRGSAGDGTAEQMTSFGFREYEGRETAPRVTPDLGAGVRSNTCETPW